MPRVGHRSRLLLPVLVCAALSSGCAKLNPLATRRHAKPTASPATPTTTAAAVPPVIKRLEKAARQGSGVLLADLDGRRVAYIADEDEAAIHVVDVEDERELSTFKPGGSPSQLVMLKDGRLVASLRDVGQLVVLSGGGSTKSKLNLDARVAVASEPIGLALSSDDRTLVVTSGWGRTVTVLDARSFVKRFEHRVDREPRSVVISADDRRAFVSHAVGQTLDVIPLDGEVAPPKPHNLGGTEEFTGRHMFVGTQDRMACQGFALAKTEGGRVLAPHVLVFSGEAEVSSGYGGGAGRESEVFHVPVIDEESGKLAAESKFLRTDIESGAHRCALPRAATVGKAGLFVTCLGENTVELFDADVLNPHDVGIKKWSVPAGPTAIALDEENDRAVVWSQFAHALTRIAIGKEGDATNKPFALSSMTLIRTTTDDAASAKIERGRVLFHSTTDNRISSDGRACASCHPDGRDDSLVWSSPKGPRQTPILAGRLSGAAPFGWNGDAPDVSKHIAQTFKRLGGKGLEGEDKEALLAYLSSMKGPVANPVADQDKHASVQRGEAIFRSEQTGCAGCHGVSGDMPDGSQHDVKSRAAADVSGKFDTPSLRFVGGSAPYFHDGRYPDLKTLLVRSDGKMGHTKHLSKSDLADLESYLETL